MRTFTIVSLRLHKDTEVWRSQSEHVLAGGGENSFLPSACYRYLTPLPTCGIFAQRSGGVVCCASFIGTESSQIVTNI